MSFITVPQEKKDEIKMILSSIAKSMHENPNRDKLVFEFQYMFKKNWINQLYDEDEQESDDFKELIMALDSIRGYGKFRNLMDDLSDEVIAEYKKLNAERESVHDEDDDDDD